MRHKYRDFVKVSKKCTAEPYSFLVNDATLASDNPLKFSKKSFQYVIKPLQLMIRLKMKNYKYDAILVEKLPKYQPCHHANLISMNILQAKKYYHLIKNKQ